MKVSNNLNEGMTYVSPSIKVVEMKARRVMCQSNGSTESYSNDSWNINN